MTTKKINQVLLFLLFLFLPTQLGKHFFFDFSYLHGVRVDYLAPTIYLTDIIIFLLVILNLKKILLLGRNKKILLILILFLINIFFSLSIPTSIYHLIKIIELAALVVIVKKNKLPEKKVLAAFLAGGLIEFFLAVLQLINKHSLQGIFYFLGERRLTLSTIGVAKASLSGIEILRPYATFSHPNSLAGFYLLLYFYFLTNKKMGSFFLLKYLFLLVSSLIIFFSFSKTAIITYLILNTLYFILNTKNKCRPCTMAKILIPLIIATIFLTAKTDPLTLAKRLTLAKNSLTIILKRPLTGTGLGSYLLAQSSFPSTYFDLLNQPVHNIFLLLIAEAGLVIIAVIIFFMKDLSKKLIQKKYLYLILTIVITGFFDHYWLTLEQNFLLLGVVVGLL